MKVLALNDEGNAMQTADIPRPTPATNEVLVQVKYSAIDTALDQVASKGFFAAYIHDIKVKPLVLGWHFAGTVVQVGPEAHPFKVDDAVFGHLQYEPKQKQGTFAEFITVPVTDLALIPPKVELPIAAASATESLTALQAMRDDGGLKEGDSILIIGAGGGVGSAAVGIAKALGATVTAVCSTKDVHRVKEMGADVVIDRKKQDFTKSKEKFDVVFDVSNNYTFRKGRRWLKDRGSFVNALPSMGQLLFGWLWPLVTRKRLATVGVRSKKEDLELVGNWIKDKKLTIDVDSIHDISAFATAWERQRDASKTGRVVIKVDGGW
mmetsp:Transcript_25548/g.55293  ORF Transcript_25548/g.55293 Transcript_25548/m.55293 type:complete len:322 (-) Transcript_25548:683-1648(-)